MTDFTQLTDKELSEAIDFHRRQRNLSRGVNEAMHMRQVQNVRLLEAEEARRLEEAEKAAYHYYVTHNRGDKNSDWTVTHAKKKPFATARDAADHIARSGGRQSGTVHTVNAKTGNIVQARSYDSGQAGYPRDPGIGDPRHIRDLKEEVEQIDELSKKTLGSYVKKAGGTSLNSAGAHMADYGANSNQKSFKKGINRAKGVMRAADRLTKEEAELDEGIKEKISGVIRREKQKEYPLLQNRRDVAANKAGAAYAAGDHKKGDRYMKWREDNMKKEEVEELDELSKDTLNSYWKKAATARYPLDVKARKAQDQKTNRIRSGKPLAGYKPKDELSADEKRTHMNRIHGMSRAGKTLFRSEEVELDEDTMPSNVASRLSDRHFTAAFSHKKNGNMKGYAAHLKVANRIEDAVIRAGSHMPIKSKQIEAASDKAFKEHPHRAVKTEEVELDEANKPNQYIEVTNKFTGAKSYHEVHPSKAFAALNRHNSLWNTKSSRIVSGKEAEGIRASKMKKEEVDLDEASYRDIGYANMLKADRKAEKELAKLRAQQAKAAAKTSKPEEFKEEAGLRVTKVYNKWPKKATYAVHNADRSYHKEFDSMEDAQAHKAEKSK